MESPSHSPYHCQLPSSSHHHQHPHHLSHHPHGVAPLGGPAPAGPAAAIEDPWFHAFLRMSTALYNAETYANGYLVYGEAKQIVQSYIVVYGLGISELR